MNKYALVLLLLAGSVSVHAQDVTYDYTGAPITAVYQGDLTAPPGTNLTGLPGLTGDIILASALNPNEANQIVTPMSYNFGDLLSSATVDTSNQGVVASFDFSTVNGQITGWNVELNSGTYGSTGLLQEIESLTPQGDSYTYSVRTSACGTPGAVGECFTVTSVSTSAGSWVDPPSGGIAQAPEMDPAGFAGMGLLLLGSLAVMRGRRL
jgi:hypothetical protein